jgi:peptidoglycan hydrolase-like protein with peptidoglycan-binding domain
LADEPTLRLGDSGDWVTRLQQLLEYHGVGSALTQGQFDEATEDALSRAQQQFRLEETGVCDDETWAALIAAGPSAYQAPDDQESESESELAGYDPQVWASFLAQNAASWSGEDAAWEAFCIWFAYQAAQQGLAGPAAGFLAYVEGEQDRIAAFAAYGIAITPVTDAGESPPQQPQAQHDQPVEHGGVDVAPPLAFQQYDKVPTQPLIELRDVDVPPPGPPVQWKFYQDYGSGSPEAVRLGEHLGDWAVGAGRSQPGELGRMDTITTAVNEQGLSQADAVTALGVAMDRMHPDGGAGPVMQAANGSLVIKAPGLPLALVVDVNGHTTMARYREYDPQSPLSPMF